MWLLEWLQQHLTQEGQPIRLHFATTTRFGNLNVPAVQELAVSHEEALAHAQKLGRSSWDAETLCAFIAEKLMADPASLAPAMPVVPAAQPRLV